MIGMVLLSINNYYIGHTGGLPERPDFDKDLLLALCKGMNVLCSPNTEKHLPKSVFEAANTVNSVAHLKDINLGIATFKTNPPDIMLVVRGISSLKGGKKFDMQWLKDNYKCVSKNEQMWAAVSVWLRVPHQQLELDL
jgi:hypothetical protein